MANPEKPRNPLLFGLTLAGLVLVFAGALSVVITLVFFGWRIILLGVPMCGVLAQNNMLDQFLYSSCGCTLVELALLAICIPTTWWSGPRLWRAIRRFQELVGRKG